ncbi:Gfo/Idh/MocA family protein [Coralloluteibacterium stylophorae]|uniref:Gfo/Idh/MocA family oxidoreductase n=2 Tax=Coralloluteibacterium stylophorae TaxID=1776034 RepID=A0AAP2C8C4_9GAMM|nr:Gfo/Idh/MocA family oxidoreductase [Coralloluteibacterium stylophorae]MBS7455604.1 Gfo/Idh/MocA family oxidoreductase [Coralloluteibacterium stylophorae]
MNAVAPDLLRRRLLQGAGGSLLAASALGAAGAQTRVPERASGQPMPELARPLPAGPQRRLGWAVVGLGNFALNQMLPSFADSKHARLVALVSGNRDKAREVAGHYGVEDDNIYGYDDFDRIAENDAIDVVYIVLPPALHADYTIRALEAGKHVLCEKPMAPTVAECDAMIEAADRAGRKLMIAYRAQYQAHNLEAIRMIQDGELGALKYITSAHSRNTNPEEPADQWRLQKEMAGGGSLFDIGIYSLNAARYLSGEEPVRISASIHSDASDPRFREVEDLVLFRLEFPSGVIANCSSGFSTASMNRATAVGADAVLTMEPATDYYRHSLSVSSKDGTRELGLREDNQFAQEIDHLCECIRADTTPKTPGAEGRQDVRLMLAIYEAARSGRTMPFESDYRRSREELLRGYAIVEALKQA